MSSLLQIRESLYRKYRGAWSRVAENQAPLFVERESEVMQRHATRYATCTSSLLILIVCA